MTEKTLSFSKDDVNRLKCLFESLNKASRTCSLAMTSKSLCSRPFSLCGTRPNNASILDFGFTNYMTFDSTLFSSHTSSESNRYIVIANGRVACSHTL